MENGFAEGWGIYTRKNGDKYIGWVILNYFYESGIMDFSMGLVKRYLLIKQSMKGHLYRGGNMVKEKSNFQMDHLMKDNFRRIVFQEKEFTYIRMG